MKNPGQLVCWPAYVALARGRRGFETGAQVVEVGDQCTEVAFFDAQYVHRLDAANARVTRLAREQGHLAEN